MSHETVISVKKHGKWHRVGDELPEPEAKPLPMPLRLPKPLSLDEEGTFDCPVENSCKCFFAKMWRYMAMWHENKWVRSYVLEWGRVRPGLPDDEAVEIAESIIAQYGL